jgi:hypothetical protein
MTTTDEPRPPCADPLIERARALKLHGLLAHFDELDPAQLPWLQQLLDWEEQERNRRGLERRLGAAHIGTFKALADFDWDWPSECDKPAILDRQLPGLFDEHLTIHAQLVGYNQCLFNCLEAYISRVRIDAD